MRVAIIDLGTNSVRFDVNQIGPGKRLTRLHREKLMVRLGQNLFVGGKLDSGAVRRTLQAFTSFLQTARDLQVGKIVAFGTSALREAADSDRLLNLIRARTGIDVRVISGEEEARLIARGILSNENLPKKERFALVDIGGGSTEISICRGREVLHAESFALGTARLQQVFLKSSPPAAARPGELAPMEQLRRHIRSTLLPKLISEEWPRVTRIIGSSGTIRAIARINKRTGGGKAMDAKDLKKLVKSMSSMTTTQLLGVPGMEARRVDMILAGAVLMDEIAEALGAKKLFASEYSLRDGIFEEEVRVHEQHEATNIPFHVEDIYEKAAKFAQTPEDFAHYKQTVSLSETLFDKLRRLHKLEHEWRHYLTAAGILHDVGEVVSRNRHGEHSYYIVKNADLPSMEKWEVEFVGQLCLRHQDEKVDPKTLSFGSVGSKHHSKHSSAKHSSKGLGKSGEKLKRQAFMKLLAILRIADALDRSRKRVLRIASVHTDAKKVRILVSGRGAMDLELLRVEQKKELFEQIFKRELVVERAR